MPNKILRTINYNGDNYNIDAVSADTATLATSASAAGRLTTPREIDGVVFDGSASITHYGVCSDSGSIAAKTVSITGLTTSPSIPVGSKIAVRFTNSNAVANPTLNVNSSGAKPIYFGGEPVALDVITANKIYDFIYDTVNNVACWSIVGGASTSAAEPIVYGIVDPENQYDGLMPYQDKTKLDAMHVSDVTGTAPISVTTASGIATVTHATGGANTSKGDTTNQTPSFGGTFKVTSLTVDKYGHTTTLADHTVTIPNHTVTDTAGDVGLMTAADKVKLNNAVNTSITATAPIQASASTGAVTLTHANSGVTADTYGDTATDAVEPAFAGTFNVPGFTVDAKGHITAAGEHTVKIPNATADGSNAGLMSAANYTKLSNIATGATNTTVYAVSPILAHTTSSGTTVPTNGTGTIYIKHSASGPSSSADTSKGDTSNQTPGFGSTFKVTSGTVDKYGHTKTFAEHTVKIPDTVANGTDPGLMSAANFTKLSGIASGAQVNVIESIKVNGTAQTITNKAVDITVPTKFSDLTNDGAITAIKLSSNSSAETPTVSGNTRTVTIPLATESIDGLLSKNDKALLTTLNSAVVTIAGNNVSIKNGSLDAATLRSSLGLSAAMHFIGKATVAVADGSTTNPTISGYNFSTDKAAGDVIIDKDNEYEFVWDGSAWRRLGPNGSYAISDHTHDVASGSTAGFMSAADFTKLSGIASGATAVSFSRNLTSGTKIGTITINGTSTDLYSTNNTWVAFVGATAQAAGTAGYINAVPQAGETGLYFGSDGIWHGNATATTAGLMSAADFNKLAGIAAGATTNTGTVTTVTAGTGLNTSADQADSATKGSITTTGTLYLTKSGVTAGSYGPSANATPDYNATFNVPYITVDAYGRVTAASTKTVKIPATDNTDTKQSITLATDLKAYITGVTTAPTSTAAALTGVGDTGVYLTTTAGELNATQYKVNEAVTLQYNSTTKSLDFIFA